MTTKTLSSPPPAAPSAVWDQLWRHAPSEARDDALLDRERRNPRWTMILQRLEAAFGAVEGLRTIELGSGRGDLSALLAERGAKVTLLDTSDLALGQARRRFDRLGLQATYERGDLFDVCATRRGRFDVGLSSGVIEHFRGEDRTRALRAHSVALRRGGLAVISVPNARCVPYRLWKLYLELRGWWPYGFERPYTRPEMLRRSKAAGLTQLEVCCAGFWQSVGDHWGRSVLGRGPDWVDRPSCLDSVMGMSLILFGRRGA
ncbi:MAG: class I SAM-dependent methyltransferase [Planctomycetota bacterium]